GQGDEQEYHSTRDGDEHDAADGAEHGWTSTLDSPRASDAFGPETTWAKSGSQNMVAPLIRADY
ncbi:MAG TPA: hypothetical protein VMS62_09705, partial [Gemmatimonadales bacterium]|nr:hypothetical protein [Gemmatimonadales bacterium]